MLYCGNRAEHKAEGDSRSVHRSASALKVVGVAGDTIIVALEESWEKTI